MNFINDCIKSCPIGCKNIYIYIYFFRLGRWRRIKLGLSFRLLWMYFFFLSLSMTFPCDKSSHLTSHHYTINKSIFHLQSNKLPTDLKIIQNRRLKIQKMINTIIIYMYIYIYIKVNDNLTQRN